LISCPDNRNIVDFELVATTTSYTSVNSPTISRFPLGEEIVVLWVRLFGLVGLSSVVDAENVVFGNQFFTSIHSEINFGPLVTPSLIFPVSFDSQVMGLEWNNSVNTGVKDII
jgi:hypothetical protein